MSFLEDFWSAAKEEYGVGAEDVAQARRDARRAQGEQIDEPKLRQMGGNYRMPQAVGAAMGIKQNKFDEAARIKNQIGLNPKTPGQRAGVAAGAIGADLTQDQLRRFWWLLNAAQAVGEIGLEEAVYKSRPDLYAEETVQTQKLNKEGKPQFKIDQDNIKTPVMEEKARRKYKPGYIQSLAIPAGIAINTGLGLMSPFGGAPGYKAALPSEEDPTKTSNPVLEVGAKYFLGRTGNLLPYSEFVKVRPDVSKDEYGRYKAFKHDKRIDLNPFDDGKFTAPTGVVKYTNEGIHGPEVQFLGKSLPVTTGIIPYLGAVAGTALGVSNIGNITGDKTQTPNMLKRQMGSDKPIRRGFMGGLAGLAAGYGGGRIIEEIRRRRNAAENELDGTLS